ncbi:MAG: iron ABC transporter permease [Bacteroidaceae bacterium]|jgi:iron complex transport system permease protein|nr:iron ABC transporter permease [Bacteroidaceae bacterium]MBR4302148.1 iron ABC transporter permease [Bacteroidaceae bacterium]
MDRKVKTAVILISVAIALLLLLNLFIGSVKIPFKEVVSILFNGESTKQSWEFIVLQSRLPQAITALLCGASLSAAGLILQTAFRNSLAGPDILGINGGAGLGVALVMLLFGGNLSAGNITIGGSLSIVVGAMIGAFAVMALILALSNKLRSSVMLLIAGIMISYLTSSAITLLNFFSTAEGVHSYTMWGMGNFGGVTLKQLPFFSTVSLIGIGIAILMIKPLNALLLGEHYAQNLGINIMRTRTMLLISTGILVATTTAFCGPISFIGLAVPHLARLILGTNNHKSLMPVTILMGITIALLCNLISALPGDKGLIPLNAITPFIGAPVILYVLLRGNNR